MIEIKSTPPAYSSVQGDIIFTVVETVKTGDPVNFPNYKFVGDVYINSVLVARIKKEPEPQTKVGIFNIGQIVRNYITTTFNPDPDVIIAQRLIEGEFSLTVQLNFGEEYAFTTYTNLVSDDPRVYFNNYNGRLVGQTSSLTALVDRGLTDRPTNTSVWQDSTFNLLPFLSSSTDTIFLRIRAYNYSNTLVTTVSSTYSPLANELIIINASKSAINSLSVDMINATIKYYTITIDRGILPVDAIYRFDMDCECIYDIYNLHFLNKYGGFESKHFGKVSRKTISIEKKDFGKLAYTVDGNGAVSYKNANNVYNESRSVYSSLFKEKLQLNSDLLTDAEYRWLEQLVLSPMVYLEEDGYFFPVVIAETNYEPKKYVNDELTNLTISLEFGEQLNAQFR